MRIRIKPLFVVALMAALSIPVTLAAGNDVIYHGQALERYMFSIPAKFVKSSPTTISVDGTWAENRALQITIHDKEQVDTLFDKMKVVGNNNKTISAQEIIEIENEIYVLNFDLEFLNNN
jgi:hypothetical protein